MTIQEALHNFQVLANKYQGTLAEHMALGRSLQVLREAVEPTHVESSAGVAEIDVIVEDEKPKKKVKKSKK
jgi:hypothetical protein